MRSASSAPPWLNMSSNDCSRAASISRTASPRLPITSASASALSRNVVGDLVAALDDGLGDARAGLLELGDDVAAAQAQVEHERIAGGLERGVHLLDAARRSSRRAGCRCRSPARSSRCERLLIMSRMAADFCAKPSVTRSSRTDIMCWRLAAISVNSSPMWSVLKFSVGGQAVAGRPRSPARCPGWWLRGGRAGRRRARPASGSWCRRRGRARA